MKRAIRGRPYFAAIKAADVESHSLPTGLDEQRERTHRHSRLCGAAHQPIGESASPKIVPKSSSGKLRIPFPPQDGQPKPTPFRSKWDPRQAPDRQVCAGTRVQRVQNSGLNLWVDGTVRGA